MKKFFKKILGLKDWHGSAKAWFQNTSEKIIGLIISAILISIAGFLIWDVAQKGHKNLDYLTKINYTTLQMSTFIENIRVYYTLHPDEKDTSVEKMIKIGAVPDSIVVDSGNKLINPYGGNILIKGTKPMENKQLKLESPTFKISYQGLPRDVCIGLATMDWGDKVRGLLAMAIGTYDAKTKKDSAFENVDKEFDNSELKMSYFVDKSGKKRAIRKRATHISNVAKPGDSYMPAPFKESAARAECTCVVKDNCSFALHYTVFSVDEDNKKEEKVN